MTFKYKVTREGHTFLSYSIEFLDQECIRNKTITALKLVVIVWRYFIYLFAEEQRSKLGYTISEFINCAHSTVRTLVRSHDKVTRVKVTLCFLTPSTSLTQHIAIRNKKITALACTVPDVYVFDFLSHVTSCNVMTS